MFALKSICFILLLLVSSRVFFWKEQHYYLLFKQTVLFTLYRVYMLKILTYPATCMTCMYSIQQKKRVIKTKKWGEKCMFVSYYFQKYFFYLLWIGLSNFVVFNSMIACEVSCFYFTKLVKYDLLLFMHHSFFHSWALLILTIFCTWRKMCIYFTGWIDEFSNNKWRVHTLHIVWNTVLPQAGQVEKRFNNYRCLFFFSSKYSTPVYYIIHIYRVIFPNILNRKTQWYILIRPPFYVYHRNQKQAILLVNFTRMYNIDIIIIIII